MMQVVGAERFALSHNSAGVDGRYPQAPISGDYSIRLL